MVSLNKRALSCRLPFEIIACILLLFKAELKTVRMLCDSGRSLVCLGCCFRASGIGASFIRQTQQIIGRGIEIKRKFD